MRSKPEYKELSRARISDTRNVVVSSCSEGGFTIAQQLEAEEAAGTTSVFMKGAFHVKHSDGLYNLRDAINHAIRITEENESEIPWDDEQEVE